MGNVTVQKDTIVNPLELMGVEAGICWNAPISDEEKNVKRGSNCLNSGHGRVSEFPQIYLTIEGYSARVIRELYTHIGGLPTRLQESTRYVNCKDFKYVTPPSIENDAPLKNFYDYLMAKIAEAYEAFESNGVPREDIANILPLGMETKIVIRLNLRELLSMCEQRLCTRAYWEFRNLMKDILNALSEYSDEWKKFVKTYCKPKCEKIGYCNEEKCCGRKPNKEEFFKVYELGLEYQKQIDDGK